MIHTPDPIAARCVVPGIDCCLAPDHVTITCPTCRGEADYRQVGRMSPPELAECPQCENHGTVIACRACDYEQHITREG